MTRTELALNRRDSVVVQALLPGTEDRPMTDLANAPTLSGQRRAVGRYDRLKRMGDVLCAGGALIVLSPVLLGTAALVRIKLGANVIFRQRRPGRNGQVFEILKFRTMLDPDPARGVLTDEERMTPFGRRLRATSLDELPGLINVLRGDMSLVGPRPLLPEYLERYSDEQARRHEVLPGLTGLAQVSGRNSLSWDDKFDLDLHYVRTRSLQTDVRILWATVPKVLRSEGVTEQGQATMSVFFGPRRIGVHQLQPAGDDGSDRWEVVDRGTGAIVADCQLEPAAAGEVEMTIHVAPECTEPELILSRAAEMLIGQARAQEVEVVRCMVDVEGPAREMLSTRLGFRVEHTGPGIARTTPVRPLRKTDR